MSGPELLMLLFDETIKRLTRAEYSLKDKDYKDFEDCINRTSRIVRYLIDILDMEYPISWDLKRIYDYLIFDLSRVKAGRERRKDGRRPNQPLSDTGMSEDSPLSQPLGLQKPCGKEFLPN